MPRLCSSLLLSLLIASSASAVTMDWTPIGNPGNACDPQPPSVAGGGCFGAVAYDYYIGTFEVTNAQYSEFLNAKAVSDPLGLYNPSMGIYAYGGITRSGTSGSYTYSAIAGQENKPVNYVSLSDVLRFANWMNNGQSNGDTETGAYTLLGAAETPTNVNTVSRNPGATIFLTSENEWYKAAYYDPQSASYFDYPAGSNAQPVCSAPTAAPNTANCANAGAGLPTDVGSYPGSPSPYGTFDQAGNLVEWNEDIVRPTHGTNYRGDRGGSFETGASYNAASYREYSNPTNDYYGLGFRVAMIPEPSSGLLVIAGILGLAGWRRRVLRSA